MGSKSCGHPGERDGRYSGSCGGASASRYVDLPCSICHKTYYQQHDLRPLELFLDRTVAQSHCFQASPRPSSIPGITTSPPGCLDTPPPRHEQPHLPALLHKHATPSLHLLYLSAHPCTPPAPLPSVRSRPSSSTPTLCRPAAAVHPRLLAVTIVPS